MGSNPSQFPGEGLPVERVTWEGVQSYCAAIGGRLPTEAEWEFAARAGSLGPRYGNLDAIAWYAANSAGQPHPPGLKEPNALGLYDVLGNVWEWVADWYESAYYQRCPARDPQGPPNGKFKIVRGGAWIEDSKTVRVSFRKKVLPGIRNDNVGVRCIWEI